MADDYDKFKEKMEIWKECISGKDQNSIINQLSTMSWNAAVFRVINEARKNAATNEKGEFKLNAMVHNFINNCFFENQITTIRRLTDNYPIYGEMGVYSLVSLLQDMKKNIKLLTRANIIKINGLEYDPEPVKAKFYQYMHEQMKNGNTTCSIPCGLDFYGIEREHKYLDALTQTTPEKRSFDDLVAESIIDKLIAKVVSVASNAKNHVDKYIAHSATPESREIDINDKAEDVKITLGYIYETTKTLCQIAAFLDAYLISRISHVGFLPIPQYNHMKYIEEPLISKEKISELQKCWNEYQKETETWAGWGLDKMKMEFGLN